MGHPSLHLDTSKLPDLLDEEHYFKALEAHIEYTQKKISLWFQNILDKNFNEWLSNVAPVEIEGFLRAACLMI